MAESDDNNEWVQHLYNQPLNTNKREIRLLKLRPCKSSSDLAAFGLVRQELPAELRLADHARPYYALSYVWGSSEETQPILVDGVAVRIRLNLWRFLEALRKQILFPTPAPRKSRLIAAVRRRLSITHAQDDTIDISQVPEVLLWVDFLCINQRNVEERNSQVAMMASIFQQASAVIGWLGGCDAGRAACVLKRGLNSLHYRHRHAPRPTESRVRDMQRAVAVLATNPYWTRLWIVQEIVLARRFWILCQDVFLGWSGHNSLSEYLPEISEKEIIYIYKQKRLLPFLRKRYLQFNDYVWYQESKKRCSEIEELRQNLTRHYTSDLSRSSINTHFSVFQSVSCTEPRDRVYGMLGMLQSAFCVSIKVDYGKPLLQVYLEACIELADPENDLRTFLWLLLSLCFLSYPASVPFRSEEGPYHTELVATPSASDLSFLSDAQDLVLPLWNPVVRKVAKIETLALIVRRGRNFVMRTAQDRALGEKILCFVYSILTTRTQGDYEDNNRGRFQHTAEIVLATFEIKIGDLFHDLEKFTTSTSTSIVTRPRSDLRDSQDLDVLGTAFTPLCQDLRSFDEKIRHWVGYELVHNPIQWMRKRIAGGRQNIRLRRSLDPAASWEYDLIVTLNAAAVMDHLENMLNLADWEKSPKVKLGDLGSLTEPVDDA